MTKDERVELKLNPHLIEKVDKWRRLQPDVPSTSEAIRRLLHESLSDNTSAADFELARFQIKAAALTPGVKDRISYAHVFAWDNGIYPSFENDEFAKPFARHFKVGEDQINSLSTFLDKNWINEKCFTFYELERHFGLRQGNSDWDRSSLISSLRYMYLTQAFDEKFWSTLLTPMQHPSEARYLTADFDPERLYFQ